MSEKIITSQTIDNFRWDELPPLTEIPMKRFWKMVDPKEVRKVKAWCATAALVTIPAFYYFGPKALLLLGLIPALIWTRSVLLREKMNRQRKAAAWESYVHTMKQQQWILVDHSLDSDRMVWLYGPDIASAVHFDSFKEIQVEQQPAFTGVDVYLEVTGFNGVNHQKAWLKLVRDAEGQWVRVGGQRIRL